MTLHEFAPRRIAALLCALALTTSLIPGAAFAEAADLLPSADGGLAGVATNESAATDESAAAAEGPLPVAAAYAASRMSAAALPLADGQDFSDHTVTDAVTPEGTTIDLFDYWLDTQDAEDTSTPTNYDTGINKGHSLHFGAGMASTGGTPKPQDLNAYTSSAQPRQGLVENRLAGGYPRLTSVATSGSSESLAYLFDSTSHDGKAVYPDVGGLLQVDDDGYFYYDCGENFASYDISDSNTERKFTLYEKGAVEPKGNSQGPQFFPFDTANEVFEIETDGTLASKPDLNSQDPTLNHFFGIHMSTQFVQQDGGKTTSGKPVTYNFSGDDDVWVFIDGVLVGDLGGIHDTTSLEINFATGAVVVYQDGGEQDDGERNNAYDSGEVIFEPSTLKAKFAAAGVNTSQGFTGNTFADGTTHTLDFFYLERGGTDSNMRLKYNLVDIPVSGIVKQDQDGKPLPGVKFALYPTDADYDYSNSKSYYTGTTNKNGSLTFTKQQASTGKDVAITMAELRNISQYWVLVEDPGATGDTYRLPGSIRLYFYKDTNLLLSANAWETGTYAQPHVTVQARSIPNNANKMFAVVMKKVDNDWLPVSGNARDGWRVAQDDSDKSLWDAAKANNTFFEVETSGAYALTIDDLPGDVTTYEYIINQTNGDTTTAQYKVQYFTANDDGMNVQPVTDTSGFARTFSVTLAIANIELPAPTLRKTDESGDPLAGVTFALYKTDADFDKQGAALLQTLTSDAQGKLTVSDEVGKDTISQGYYLLEETSAPAPYVAQSTPIQIVVNDDGIFVNAGTATDNVTVETGIHALANSMKGFAADDDVDATLHDVQAKPQTGAWDAARGTFTWADTSANALHLNYAPTAGSGLIYQPTDNIPGNAGTYTATEGWSRLNITQCRNHNSGTQNKQDLGTQSLNALFTGSTVIHVVNSKPATPTPSATPPETTPTPQPTPAPTPTPVSQPTPQPTAAPAAVSAIPQTSDDMPVGALTALAAAAAAAFVVLVVVRKRRHGKD
ncbi:MAG TPA: hypothetical protein H9811_04570 [Candidatus Gemmiger excrementigallinarum]|uniref:PA14 domain-containing protein n=1 Tax=Candidatus Gemmiger excrementigallinarum TaxID=2838609 RepID=A0A9D2EQJ5_9FIRM|nr:hypothetical protein [Candidatus Gemmiger excrementigallinarum]